MRFEAKAFMPKKFKQDNQAKSNSMKLPENSEQIFNQKNMQEFSESKQDL